MAKIRIAKEIEEFKKDPFYNKKYGIEIINNNDLFHCSGWITGLENTPYENGTFFFNVHFPTDYPFAPFKINMTTRIFHISINVVNQLIIIIYYCYKIKSLSILFF
jgi:ubiquitin-protein ligase